MTIETSYGFRSAQAAYENATPYDGECECPQLFKCNRCDELSTEGGTCKDAQCVADNVDEYGEPSVMEPIEREDEVFEALPGCRQHGGCTGCDRRSCADCN